MATALVVFGFGAQTTSQPLPETNVSRASAAATAKPAAPSGLAVTPGDRQLTITWNASPAEHEVDRYQIYRNDGYTQVADVTPPATSYVMTGLRNGTTYKIRVGAHNAIGYGPWSSPISVAPKAGTPPPTTTTTEEPPPPPPPTTTAPTTTAPPPPPPPPPGDSAELRPFDPAHPVYQPMPTNAAVYKDSAAIVNLIVASKRSMAFDTGSESPPIYVGSSTDPLYRIGSYQVHVPITAKAGTGSDYPLVIQDSATKTEYRMWQARINHSTRVITYNGFGVGSYRNDGTIIQGKRALGQAEIAGQNTGSGESYTVGMVREPDLARGRIDHAIRVAIGYPRNNLWFWPALRTENQGYATSGLDHAPMGARIAIRSDFNLAPLEADINSNSTLSAKGKSATITVLRALKEFGMIALDGTTGAHNLYFQGTPSIDWTATMGPKNSYGSYNDLARGLVRALNLNNNAGWKAMFVADPSVFDGYAR